MPPKKQSKEENLIQKDLENLKGAAAKVQQHFTEKEASGNLVDVDDVDEGKLICFKDKSGRLKCGFAGVFGDDDPFAVLQTNKKKTPSAGQMVTLVEGVITDKSIDDIFEDEEFDISKDKKEAKISQEDIVSGSYIRFSNKKGTTYCGYAYRNGSNIRIVCKEKEIKLLQPGKVWQSNEIKTDKKSNKISKEDFKFNEKAIKKEAKNLFDCYEINERIRKMEIRNK